MRALSQVPGKVKLKIFKKFRYIKNVIYGHYKKVEDIDISPIFILGSNRSGTSLISSILGQHPQLEGIFEGSTEPLLQVKHDDHTSAYCMSHHVWSSMSHSGGENWFRK